MHETQRSDNRVARHRSTVSALSFCFSKRTETISTKARSSGRDKTALKMINTSDNFSLAVDRNVVLYTLEESIAQTVSLVFIVLAGLSGNFYVCYIIHGSKHKNPTLMFILNLAFANIGALTLCTPLPLGISIKRRYFIDNWLCLTSGFLNNFFFCASIFILWLLTTHKYFTVIKPGFCMCLHLTEKRPKACLLAIWMGSSVMSLLSLGPFTGWTYISFNPTTAHCGMSFPVSLAEKLRLTMLAVLAFAVPLAFMAYAYCRIYWKINAHEKRLAGRIRRANSVKRKLTLTLCLMFGTFVACWTPFFLLIILAIILKEPDDLPASLGRIAYWFGYINCCLNPVFYCIRTSTFRDLMREKQSVTMSQNLSFIAPNRSKRAFSLPSLSPKRRHSSSVGSVTISPTKILVSNSDINTSNDNSLPTLRTPRVRAFSWSTDYKFPGKVTTNVQSPSQITVSRFKDIKDTKERIKKNTMCPETISENPAEMVDNKVVCLDALPKEINGNDASTL